MVRRSAPLLCLLLAATAQAAPYRAPRTPDGRPDFQGEWTNATWTPLQRPRAFKSLTATQAEADTYLRGVLDFLENKEPPRKLGDPPPEPDVGFSEWFDGAPAFLRLDGGLRSSIIVEPSDGRLPYNAFGRQASRAAFQRDETGMDGPEDRSGEERCLVALSSMTGAPMLPSGYNGHYRIVQTPGAVAIESEMIHDVRLVRMGATHDGGAARWGGDSVGRWEGETLVVETVGQHPVEAERFIGPAVMLITPGARVTERFTRTGPTEIRYAFEVDDPAVYSRPWRGELRFTATDAPMYEYACHEGNHALPNILAGARRTEADAKAAADKAKAVPAKSKAE